MTHPAGYFSLPDSPPPFIPGTERLLAWPRDTPVACVQAPATADILIAGGSFTLLEGDWHVALDGETHMIGVDFVVSGVNATHRLDPTPLDPKQDPRAALLRGIWSQYGHQPVVRTAQRTSTMWIIGQIADAPEISGRRFGYPGGVFATLEPRAYLLRSPVDGHFWVVGEGLMARLFSHITTDYGEWVKTLTA